MGRHFLRTHAATFVALLLIASQAASAQETAAPLDLRSRWGAQIGGVAYGTGEDDCPGDSGLTFGAEVRTRGVWLGAVGVDFFYPGDPLCGLPLTLLIFRGETVTEHGRTRLDGAPRLRARVGRTVTVGGLQVEPAIGLGAIHGKSNFSGPADRSWNAWAGGSVTLRSSDSPVGLELAYGVHQVRRSYRTWPSGEVVREFRRWKPFFRISVVR